ncbi:putative oxidoreductase, partial [Sesbania bispinosa]
VRDGLTENTYFSQHDVPYSPKLGRTYVGRLRSDGTPCWYSSDEELELASRHVDRVEEDHEEEWEVDCQ